MKCTNIVASPVFLRHLWECLKLWRNLKYLLHFMMVRSCVRSEFKVVNPFAVNCPWINATMAGDKVTYPIPPFERKDPVYGRMFFFMICLHVWEGEKWATGKRRCTLSVSKTCKIKNVSVCFLIKQRLSSRVTAGKKCTEVSKKRVFMTSAQLKNSLASYVQFPLKTYFLLFSHRPFLVNFPSQTSFTEASETKGERKRWWPPKSCISALTNCRFFPFKTVINASKKNPLEKIPFFSVWPSRAQWLQRGTLISKWPVRVLLFYQVYQLFKTLWGLALKL